MNADTADLCKRRFWTRGHSSQVLESTVDGSKYQAKLRLQLNDEMIGTTNAKLWRTYFLTFKKLECLVYPGILQHKLIFKYEQLHSILRNRILHSTSRLIISDIFL